MQHLQSLATQIIETLHKNGFIGVFCGGCVRDMLMGNEAHDIDIATSALPDDIERIFPKTVAVGKSFGVIVVIIDGEEFEVATFRSDGEYSDGRRPDSVSFCSMEEDSKRRDMTINGLFYDPIANITYDYTGGQRDIAEKVIQLIGNPHDRIIEDKLRLLRVIRFSARFDFEIEPATYTAVKEHASEVTTVSSERIADEMTKILRVSNKRKALELLFHTGLLYAILPEVAAMKYCEQPKIFHPEGDVFEHTILALSELPEDASDTLLWGTLLHDVGKPPTQTFEDRIRFSGHDKKGMHMAEEILRRYKFSNDFVDQVTALVENHMKFMCVQGMRTSTLKRFMNLDKFDEHLQLHKVDCLSSHGGLKHYDFMVEKLKTFEATPEKVMLNKLPRLVTGDDLIEMGYHKGPLFRTILTAVEDQQLEDTITTREQALAFIRKEYP
jgi:putative nucleotidyltransferase with HDIG domain